MAFVQESGNPGLAAATMGAAAGFQKARDIQERAQAQEMALMELQLRQTQSQLQLDTFAERVRAAKSEEVRADLRIAQDQSRLDLDQSKWNFLRQESDRDLELQKARGEADMLLARVMRDGNASEEDMRVIESATQGLPAEVRGAALMRMADFKREQDAINARQRQAGLERTVQFVYSAPGTEGDKAKRIQALVNAEAQFGVGSQEYHDVAYALQNELIDAEVKKNDSLKWAEESGAHVAAAVKDPAELAQAQSLLIRAQQLIQKDPNDPEIAQIQEQIDWLVTPPKQRERHEQLKHENQVAQYALSTSGAVTGDQADKMMQVQMTQNALLSQLVGEQFAKSEERRGQMLVQGMKSMGMDVRLDVLLPVDVALPQQVLFAFQQRQNAEQAMDGVYPQEMIDAHVSKLMERNGLQNDDILQATYEGWKVNPVNDVPQNFDMAQILAINDYKAEQRPIQEEAEYARRRADSARQEAASAEMDRRRVQAAVESDTGWIRAFENAKGSKSKVEALGWPDPMLEAEARKRGWKPKKVKGWPTSNGRPATYADGKLKPGMYEAATKDSMVAGEVRFGAQKFLVAWKDGEPYVKRKIQREQLREEAETEGAKKGAWDNALKDPNSWASKFMEAKKAKANAAIWALGPPPKYLEHWALINGWRPRK